MAKRTVVKIGDQMLRLKSKAVVNFDESLWQLLDDMKETMNAENGVGIAAVQVAVLRRACIVFADDEYIEFINPVIISSSGNQFIQEGCLSVPDTHGEVDRPKKITVKAYDRFGKPFACKMSGYKAIVCCHEFDHLDGVLFTDKMKKNKDKEGN